jgi:hypothetical protein
MNLIQTCKNVGTRAKALAFGGAAALSTPLAFASGGGASFDSAEVLAAIAGMLAAGVLIYTAYAVGKWTLRAFGLIGGK